MSFLRRMLLRNHRQFFLVGILILSLSVFTACGGGDNVPDDPDTPVVPGGDIPDVPNTPDKPSDENPESPEKPDEPDAPDFPDEPVSSLISSDFWGTWIRMDNGDVYKITDNSVTVNGNTTSGIGVITKESENVLKYGSESTSPRLFRKGGSNRDFSLMLAGFDDGPRAAGSSIVGKSVRRKNKEIEADTQTKTADEDGLVTFTGAVADDVQVITVKMNNGSDVKIEATPKYSGENIGTIPLVESGYSFKTTYEISGGLNGYYYANNYDTYPLQIDFTNIGDADCGTARYSISCSDPNLSISGNTEDIFTTIETGRSKSVNLNVRYGELTTAYKDVTIKIEIQDSILFRTWKDSVTLRFYRRPVYVSVNAYNPDENPSSELHGFVINADGRSQYFSVNHASYTNIIVPWTTSEKPLTLVFSGATADDEMFYSFTISKTELAYNDLFGWSTELAGMSGTGKFNIVTSYETPTKNDYEDSKVYIDNPSIITKSYIQKGDIDYFSISSEKILAINASSPVISVQPHNVTGNSGKEVNLSVSASSTDGGTLTYQWYRESSESGTGTAIAGATASTYTAPTDTQGTTYYYCVVTNTIEDNGDRGIKSDSVKTYVVSVEIDDSLPSYDIAFRTDNDIEITADGNNFTADGGYTNYTWYVDGVVKQNGASNAYEFTETASGVYTLVVIATDTYGNYYSASAKVSKRITVTKQELEQTLSINAFEDAAITKTGTTFTATEGYTNYVWYVDRIVKQTGASATYTVDDSKAGAYDVMVVATDADGNYYSASAQIKIEIIVETGDSSVVVSIRDYTDLSLTASGKTLTASSGYSNYVWYVDRILKQNGATNTYTLTETMKGSYDILVIATAADGQIYSATAQIINE